MIDPLDMLLPQALPSDAEVGAWICSQPHLDLAMSDLGRGQGITNLAMAVDLRRTISAFPAAGQIFTDSHSQPDDIAHDCYFHVRRVESDAPTVFVRMACHARLIFLHEVADSPVNISREALELIDLAFADLIACLMGSSVNSKPHVTEFQTRGLVKNVISRWIRGHQIFAALTQGLIFAFQMLGRAVRLGKGSELQRWADLSCSLFRGSGAAFELTGDFPIDDYVAIVRPSMMPPATVTGLSGLMSMDHRFLVQTMRDMRPALKAFYELEPVLHNAVSSALSTVYDSHVHVCERFVGAKPSLLSEGRSDKTGPSMIEQFKKLRLKPFEQPTRATRLTSADDLSQCPVSKGRGVLQSADSK